MDDINSIFPKTLGYGYRKDATFRREGLEHFIDYENLGELVYRVRVGERAEIQEFDKGRMAGSTTHRDLESAFLHHGLAVYGFDRKNGLPALEKRLLKSLPEGSFGQVFAPGWEEEPLEAYYPDGILRRILIPCWRDPNSPAHYLIWRGIDESSILEIPDATLTSEGQHGNRTSEPAYLVHVVVVAREVDSIFRALAGLGLTGPGIRQRPILLYAHPLRWPATLGFDGAPGDPVRRYEFGLPGGLKKTFLESLSRVEEEGDGE